MRYVKKAVPVGMLAVAAALTGCATTASGDGYAPQTVTVVEVTNNNASRVVVDAISLGIDRRLGEVETSSTESFILPKSVSLSDVEIRIDPIGPPGSFLTDRLNVGLGDVIQVTVQPNLGMTTVAMR